MKMSSFRVLLPQQKIGKSKKKKKYWICWTILNKLKEEEEVKHCSEISFKLYIKRSERSGEKTCRKMVKNWNWNLFRFSINYKLVKRSETNTHPHTLTHLYRIVFIFSYLTLPHYKNEGKQSSRWNDRHTEIHSYTHT